MQVLAVALQGITAASSVLSPFQGSYTVSKIHDFSRPFSQVSMTHANDTLAQYIINLPTIKLFFYSRTKRHVQYTYEDISILDETPFKLIAKLDAQENK